MTGKPFKRVSVFTPVHERITRRLLVGSGITYNSRVSWFRFEYKSGLRKNRQIRMIRNIHYPMDYYLVHVYTGPVNVTNATDPEIAKRKKVVECGAALKKFSAEFLGLSLSASGGLIPVELQVVFYNTYEL